MLWNRCASLLLLSFSASVYNIVVVLSLFEATTAFPLQSLLLHRRANFSTTTTTAGMVLAAAAATANSSTSTPSGKQKNSRSIPKEETQILDLLRRSPEADGRDVKIAILDTGCDLAAAGLQTTTDGKPKYLDFLDCTGDGDIDTSKKVEVPESKVITGLSGRELQLGDWAPTTTEVRLGGVRLYDLVPGSVQRRLKRDRKELFERNHDRLIAQTQQQLDELQVKIDSTTKKEDAESKTKLIKQRKDVETLLEQYQAILEKRGKDDDAGPFMDVILFQDEGDEGAFKAVIDLEAKGGNLTQAVPMTPFGKSRQLGTLGFGSAVTFCIQIYDEGKTLSIVTDAGSHGTHVAGIAAANFGNDDVTAIKTYDKNGVAPGAQILACKIGDGRLGSAETGTGLIRALIAAKKYGCDLVNLSYGEPSWQSDSGRVAQVFSDATRKWGMTVFTSAGNDGPALSSLGSPGTLSAPITVGAFVSKDMMIDQYSTLPLSDDSQQELQDASYYFSSRGPTPDGAFPDLCAPGGAIAPIPRHSLQGKAQYHGTSMSSPNACGVTACILSALKQQGLQCAHAELRRGLLNSATPVNGIQDRFAQGSGLISATGAVDYIVKHHGKAGQDVTFDISIPSQNDGRGIYVRDAMQLKGPMTFDVKVLPHFDHALVRTSEEIEELLSLELDLDLTPSASWVICPERMSLLSAQERNGQTFAVRLATEDLGPGAHFATVNAVDASDPSRGPIFEVPITVIIPHSTSVSPSSPIAHLNDDETITLKENGIDVSMSYKLEPGAPNRRFLEVPTQAEWATIKIRSSSPDATETSPQRILLHAIPFVRGDLPNTEIQLKRLVAVTEGVEKEFRMKVKGGSTMEVCLQLLWLSNPAAASVVADVEFHSLNCRAPTLVSSQPLVISAGREFARFEASANLRSETLNPKASLSTVQRTLRPSSYDIVSGSADRDIMPPSDAELKANPGLSSGEGTEIFNMFLKYEFKFDSDKDVKVTPFIPSLFHQLYDSPLDSQIWELKDGNMQTLASGSCIHHEDAVSLGKGNYTIIFHTRHPSRQVLEQVKDIPVQLNFSTDTLDCKVYSELDKASTPTVTGDGRSEVGSKVLQKGGFQDLYVSRPIGDLPSFVAPGDVMTGTVVLDKDKEDVTSMALIYQVPPKSQVKKRIENKLPESNGDDEEEKTLEETIFQSKISYLSKVRSKNATTHEELSAALLKENPKSIPLLSELLSFAKESKLEGDDTKRVRVDRIRQVRDLLPSSNGGPIDESALAQYFGVTAPSDDELAEDKEAKKLKTEMDEQRKLLRECLLALSNELSTFSLSDTSRLDDFDGSVKELKKWASGPDAFSEASEKVLYALTLSRQLRLCKGENGGAISKLMDALKESKSTESCKDLSEELLSISKLLDGNEHVAEHLQNDILKRFPPKP
jgi:tripeptidyl-peptidase-2